MFGTDHPRPLHRKEVAMHVVRQEERRLDSHTLTVDVPDAPPVAPPPDPRSIRFDVVYTLPEYLGFVRDHLAFLRRRTGGPLLGARRDTCAQLGRHPGRAALSPWLSGDVRPGCDADSVPVYGPGAGSGVPAAGIGRCPIRS